MTGTFHAHRTTTYSPGVGSVIIFDSILYNTGEYSAATGVFIAPLAGIYVFSYTIYAVNAQCWVDLFVDTTTVSAMFVHSPTPEASGVSGTTIVQLSQYQEVMLKFNSGDGASIGGVYSQFNGFLLA